MSNGATVSFGQTSLTRDGFWRVPNKVLYQWGRATLTGGGGSTTITFPKAFVIACLNVQATVIASPNTGFVYSTQVETVRQDKLSAERQPRRRHRRRHRSADGGLLAGGRVLVSAGVGR